VRGMVIRLAASVGLATAVLLGLVLALPGQRGLFVGIYELTLGAIGILAILGALRAKQPRAWELSPFERPPERPPRAEQVAELERLDRVLVMASTSAFDVHHRLRPLVRNLAAERLHAHHGIDLEREPERVKAVAGDELWELLRPDRELGRRSGPGLPVPVTSRVVDELEAL
jgi:hypothetical protein